jgi:cephalosporin hydroxylase
MSVLRRAWNAAAFRVSQRRRQATIARAHRILYGSGVGGHTHWLGTNAVKNPLDLWVYQEIVWETKPEVIVETGTFKGGSALFLASICDLVGSGEVISVDVRPASGDYPRHPRITYLGGRSSTDPEVVAEVRERVAGRRAMVLLDSDHSQAHVEGELAAYAPLVAEGCYLVVEDSNIGEVHVELLPGPMEAIDAFLARTSEFEVDREREKFLITFNPRGYLRRIAPPGAA